MKITMIKHIGGTLTPANDREADKLTKFKNGEHYETDIKLSRNPDFHRKVFAFFNFCYEYWDGQTAHEHLTDEAQMLRFRQDLMILAGYYEHAVRLDGHAVLTAKSLAFASMEQEEFEHCYTALINAACKHLFKDASEEIYNKLLSFF